MTHTVSGNKLWVQMSKYMDPAFKVLIVSQRTKYMTYTQYSK